jgi:hypothetical protein
MSRDGHVNPCNAKSLKSGKAARYIRAMTGLFVFLVFCLLFYFFYRAASRSQVSRGRKQVTVTARAFDPDEYKEKNQAREKRLKERYPDADKWIYSKVAGVSHRNKSGSSRQKILRECRPMETLRIVSEPDNPVSSQAMAIHRENGKQIGYLPHRLGEEMYQRVASGEQWQCVLTEITGQDHRILGANIALFRARKATAGAS